jgi:predicted transcriptional regulator
MLAKDLVSDIIPTLRTSDTGQKALSWMELFRVSHLPIVNNTELLGLVSDHEIFDQGCQEEAIGSLNLSNFSAYVTVNQHLLEIIALVGSLNVSVVPVIDENNKYMGCITQQQLITAFAEATAVKQPGAILVLEMNANDYSLSQISQIVESNDTKILGAYVTSMNDSTRITVTLKLNRVEIASVIQTFNRYNYIIQASYLEDDKVDAIVSERMDLLMRYLNM